MDIKTMRELLGSYRDAVRRADEIQMELGRVRDNYASISSQTLDGMPHSTKIHDLSAMSVVASVDEMDLDRAEIGDTVAVVFDRYPEVELHGTVTQISRIGMPKQNATYYDVTISIITNLEVLPGMNAVVTLK
jgi:hypothetical protein